jgi:Fe-S cluster assembly protein SufD
MSTEARDALLRAIERRGALPGAPWLQEQREAAKASFAEQGLPTRRDEAWRFTDLSALAGLDLEAHAAEVRELALPDGVLGEECHRLVFVDGVFSSVHSSTAMLPPGVTLRPVGGTLDGSARELAPLFAVSDGKRRSLSALNAALFEDGALLHVEEGVEVEDPIYLVFVQRGAPLCTPRSAIALAPRSRARVVEHYVGSDAASLVAPVTEVDLGAESELLHVHLQAQGETTLHLAELAVQQGEQSRLRSFSLALGAKLARVDIASELAGPGSHADLLGLYAGRAAQHLDHHTTIDHATPHTTSRELYKGILDERAKGVFLGHIHVRPHAQKIDAMQTNRTLLLSDSASIHTRPQLEIHADDVRCSHGASIGRLDESWLFYLRARGIGEREARALLLSAFAGEVLGELPWPALRAYVAARLGLPEAVA